jgi:hypothetical protein
MRSTLRFAAAALVAVASLLVCPGRALAQLDPETMLGKAVSPSTEVLLVGHGRDSRVQSRWRGAVTHPSPEVRSTVARAIQMGGAVSLVDDVDQRLKDEDDLHAAGEQAATVTAILGRISDNTRAACTRLGAPVAAAVAESLARVAPSLLLTELPALRSHGADVDIALVQILRRWLRTSPGQAARLQLALVRAGDEHAWRVVLRAIDDADLTLGGGPLATALGSKRPGVAALGLVYLLQLEDQAFAAVVAETGVRPALDGLLGNQSGPGVRLARAIVGRRIGETMPTGWLDDAARVQAGDPIRLLGPSNIGGLAPEDAAALARKWKVEVHPRRAEPRATSEVRGGTTFIADLPSPILADVLRETRCQARYSAATVRVRYGADGRPASLVVSDDTKAACREVVGALVALMPGVPGHDQSVIVPLDLDVPRRFGTRPAVQPRYIPGAWNAPHPADVAAKLVKFVEPTYGNVSLKHKLVDEVIFDIVLDDSGAVTSLQFRRSVHPELNTSAARAILQMKFSPSQVAGRAVPTRSQFSFTLGG